MFASERGIDPLQSLVGQGLAFLAYLSTAPDPNEVEWPDSLVRFTVALNALLEDMVALRNRRPS